MIDRNERSDALDPARGCCLGVAVMLVVAAATIVLCIIGCPKRAGAATDWEVEASRILASSTVDAVKRDLVRQAIAHESKAFRAKTVYYIPTEAGSGWAKWSHTRTGELVKPGVASCTVDYWHRWGGAWIWFADHGVTKVVDNFPEASSPVMFDLAPPERYPGQPYEEWLWDPTRIWIARNRNVWTDAVVLKPRKGWKQLTARPK